MTAITPPDTVSSWFQNAAQSHNPQDMFNNVVGEYKGKADKFGDKFDEFLGITGLKADPCSPFANPLDTDFAKDLVNPDVNPYKKNSLYKSSICWFRNYYSETTFYTPSKVDDSNGSSFSKLTNGISIRAMLSKPKYFMSLPQARSVGVLSPSYLPNLPAPDKNATASTLLPTTAVSPLKTLAELLEILGKLSPQPVKVAAPDASVDPSAALKTDAAKKADPLKDDKNPKLPKTSKEAATTLTVNDGFKNLGWHESFLSKAAGLDGVLANAMNSADEEWTWSNLGSNLVSAMPAFRDNFVANGTRDDDIKFIGNQAQEIYEDAPKTISKVSKAYRRAGHNRKMIQNQL